MVDFKCQNGPALTTGNPSWLTPGLCHVDPPSLSAQICFSPKDLLTFWQYKCNHLDAAHVFLAISLRSLVVFIKWQLKTVIWVLAVLIPTGIVSGARTEAVDLFWPLTCLPCP